MSKKILGNSKITRRYQITLSKDVREKFNFDIGDLVVFTVSQDGELVIKKVQV
ncbi:MAG: AbrB/MazE/SpoVT family DNA-binding domain-containing protein [Candidatus Bathyarchaeota archaeon]